MSWAVYLMKVPEGINSLADLDKDFRPSSLGNSNDIISIFKELFPDVDFPDDTCGYLGDDGYMIQIILPEDNPVDTILLYPRGLKCLEVVEKICNHTGWRALDTSTGEYMDFSIK